MKQRGGLLVALGLCVAFGTGCAGMALAYKQSVREPDNEGTSLSASLDTVQQAAEKALQKMGYETADYPNHKGFDALGIQVQGQKVSQASAGDMVKNAGVNLAMGVLGSKSTTIRASSTVMVYVNVNEKWNETDWSSVVPGAVVLQVSGQKFDTDTNGNNYNQEPLSDFDANAARDYILKYVAWYQRSGRQ